MTNQPSYILGIHSGHNASVCLMKDGNVIYAIQEERLTYTKVYQGFPYKSVKAALDFANIRPEDIAIVALASNHVAVSDNQSDVLDQYKKEERNHLHQVLLLLSKTPLYKFFQSKVRAKRLKQVEEQGFKPEQIKFVEHHLCHAAAAYYGLNIPKDEKCLVLTLDGSGDGLCATVSVGQDGELKRISSTDKGNSIGNIYSRITYLLGFKPWEHEYKLMGMAPYASEFGTNKAFDKFNRYLDLPDDNPLEFKRSMLLPTHLIYNRIRKDIHNVRFDWVCAGLQKFTENLVCQWVENCVKHTGINTVALSGGVFMNVKANKKIMELDCVNDVHIMPSCGDETNSFGSALYAYHSVNKKPPQPFPHIYLGNDVEEKNILDSLNECKGDHSNFKSDYIDNIEEKIAELLANNSIVARCKGQMEFGARALGNRSILANPSNLHSVQRINMMIKKRDFWMPFAPVIMKEYVKEYAINPKGCISPYMMLSFDTTDKKDTILAAVHAADHTARFQILEREANPSYYKIIEEFHKHTGIPVLLNTSFNLHGYPIVLGAKEALHVFFNSELEYLALGNYLISKTNASVDSSVNTATSSQQR